jgi:hypothetical protein
MTSFFKCRRILAAVWFAACIALLGLRAQGIKDQLPPELPVARQSGDSVQPVFEGWQRNADGTINMWFGYFNRNQREIVEVPIGPANNFNTGADSGQPTHFTRGGTGMYSKSPCRKTGTRIKS